MSMKEKNQQSKIISPLLLGLLIIGFIIYSNFTNFTRTVEKFGIPEYELIRKYLETMLSWPVTVLILGLILLFKFSESINNFFENSKLRKAGPFEFEQKQQIPSSKEIEEKAAGEVNLTGDQLKQIEQAFQEKETQLANKDEAIKFLLERSELIEFAYLNLILVYNTKIALMWFYLQIEHQSTKDNFINLYILPPNITNPSIEKEAIFNALLSNQLIEQNGQLFKITEKGKRFLKYLGFNIND